MGLLDRVLPITASAQRMEIDRPQLTVVPDAPAYNVNRAMVGSASRIDLNKAADRESIANRPYAEWQTEAWNYYDAIGEIKYAFGLVGSVFSRLRLYPALVIDEDSPPVSVSQFNRRQSVLSEDEKEKDRQQELSLPEGIPLDALETMREYVDALGSGHGGITGLLRTFALNMAVPGECYLINYQNRWSIRSTEEVYINPTDGKPRLRTKRGDSGSNPSVTSPATTSANLDKVVEGKMWVGRIWRPHPRFSEEPDSSMLALREPCDELLTLQRMIRAVARSKMNAGALFVPDSVTHAGAVPDEPLLSGEEPDGIPDDVSDEDAFVTELYNGLVEAVTDESAINTVAPMVMRGPGEDGANIKFIDFGRKSDQSLVERADRALDRVLQGIDVPKDVVTGLSNVKYSNAIQIDDSLYKSHVEPLALLLCDALTMMYLRPAIKNKHPDISEDALRKIVVWYDPTEVVTRVDPAESASTGYDKFALSGDAWRRAHGFSDLDKPGEKELALRIALQNAQVPPELATQLIRFALPSVLGEDVTTKSLPQSAQDLLRGGDGTGRPDAASRESVGQAPVSTAVPANASVPEPSTVPADDGGIEL